MPDSIIAKHSKEIRYRADIDGLRAIAVLLVVGFHMQTGLMPLPLVLWIGKHISHTLAFHLIKGPQGGFIGVDVFFVISGFLISGILLREQSTNTFSIVKFYERRVRRIFPALFGILIFVFASAYFTFTPAEMVSLAKSALAATFSGANIYFWQTSGYFEALSYPKPLLHTWSLAVEEQFYLFFPVLLLFIHRFFRKYLKAIVVAASAASFAACIAITYRYPTAAFYLPFTRAWELLIGTIVALGAVPAPSSKTMRNCVSVTGLGLILFATWYFTEATVFPGAAALIPCLGAACIILAGINGSSLVGRVLSTRPFVFVGLISYSLYLWHWPLLLLNRYEYLPAFHLNNGWLFFVMLAAATLSWKLVEQPFRSGPLKLPRRQLFAASAGAMAIISALAVWTIAAHGLPSRYTREELRIADYAEKGALEGHWGDGCFASAEHQHPSASCFSMKPDQRNYLLFGDSHAAHLWYGLSTAFPDIHFLEATASKCLPLLSSPGTPQDEFCEKLTEMVFHQFLPAHHVDAVILSAAWSDSDAPFLGKAVAYLHSLQLQVYVVGPIVIYDQPLPNLLARSIRTGDTTLAKKHRTWNAMDAKALDDRLKGAALSNGATRYLSLRDIVCPDDQCAVYAEHDVPLQFDQSHLTDAGSLLVAQRIRESALLP